ncbi:MAG TPA: Ig-like domain-containing protein [Gemmatimonadaceae bacterium]|nr:Ig-like domain-containing protein [Gemmatimonadaceae bacterium]
MKPILLGVLVFAAACGSSDASGVAPILRFATVTTELRDSTTFPAGSAVLVRAHVTSSGLGLDSVPVTWAVGTGHGGLSATMTNTDSTGVASVLWTLGDAAGVNSLVITSGDAVDTLRLVGTIGVPSSIVIVSPESSSIAVGDSLSLQVRVIDRPGNPVPNSAVNWSTTGGTLSGLTTTSDATGIARTTFRASQAGTYLVTANLPERASVIFQVVVR